MLSKRTLLHFELWNFLSLVSSSISLLQPSKQFPETMSPKKQLTYPGLKALTVATNRDVWLKCAIIQHQFWKIAHEECSCHSSETSSENVS